MEYSFVTPSTPQAPPAGPSAPPNTISARLKQRRVSLPSTQLRSHSQLFRDEMALDEPVKPEPRDERVPEPKPAKKQRKKWTTEETQMLVDGCNEWGVGNWKAILNDPRFVFQSRSPVDLKDRFRTYFPDAYRLHYPNAKTHLSSRVRSTLPDGTSIFEKTRSKKRRPFSKEEDEALRRGYEQVGNWPELTHAHVAQHGTVWATIVKDPVFQQRRSTDLRDRFRNAFPDLYQQAGYKPRPARKTQKPRTPLYEEAGPSAKPDVPRQDKAKPGRLRIVTRPKKRVRRRRSTDDDDDDSDDDNDDDVDVDDYESEDDHPAPASQSPGAGNARGGSRMLRQHVHASRATPQPSNSGYADGPSEADDVDMSSPVAPADIELPVTPSASFPRDLTPVSPHCLDSSAQSQDSVSLEPATATDEVSSVLSSHGFDSLIYPPADADGTWLTGTAVTSPTSSDYFLHPPRRDDCMDRIGKSAWATSDWLSANPRLDNALSGALAFGPWGNANNSVVDRYNLYTSTAGVAAHEFSSEAGDHRLEHYDDFSNPISYYAGDLFPGSGIVNAAAVQMQVAEMNVPPSGGASVVDEQGVECLSLESVVQPHMLQAGLGRLSLAEANAAAGDLSDGVSMDKNAPPEHISTDAPTTIPYMLPMPSSLSNLSMAGVEALSAPVRPTHARRSHSLFDFSCMDALDLQRPGYPVSFDVDATAGAGMFADALDLAALGLQVPPAPVPPKDVVPTQRMHSAAISPSDLMIRKADGDDKMRKRTSWRV
ncbi:hypothetical protein CTheo_1489 [Ceratobasidium theobromae]|uniref:Myb-like domain-containing protein n=1 Tax=Ceratobasidium theobromae TaxID=1582974 RepID=A0A5N5QTP8_9AGAM|nr:hypothetical protein CTheo_1489 [Ceratobasidium theobromae]